MWSARWCTLAVALAGRAAAEDVLMRKVGFPEARLDERAVCGQERVGKQWYNPEYLIHLILGFRPGSCADVGYGTFERSVSVDEHPMLVFTIHRQVDVYSRDPTFLDVAGCIGRECGDELASLAGSDYGKDAAHCVGPALGQCAPKAWACLDDATCKAALECMPQVAKECGAVAWQALTDKKERERLECVARCGNSTVCVITKCGADALECLTGIDKLCHEALTCLPSKMLRCSKPAFGCLFSKDGICRENLACLAEGAQACGDPAVNLLTDSSIPTLMTCANQKCPAPETAAAALVAAPALAGPPAHYPEQLLCMNLHCGLKAVELLADKDVQALSRCLTAPVASCGQDMWACLGDGQCASALECWGNGTLGAVADVWAMVTRKDERQFLQMLAACNEQCLAEPGALQKALCVSKCGLKSSACLADETCRRTLERLPETATRCGLKSLESQQLQRAMKCLGEVAGSCGRAGIELVRDPKIAEVFACNQQCTRPPKHWPTGAAAGAGAEIAV